MELYQRLTGILETNDLAWLGLTQAYGALGQWDEALSAAESLLALKPDDVLALYNLAAIHANRGDQDQAIRLWLEVADDTSSDLADQARNNVRVLQGSS